MQHIQLPVSSGVLIITDSFRLPGFDYAVRPPNQENPWEYNYSELGLNLRTQDFYERLGILCVRCEHHAAAFIQEGGVVFVGGIDDEHEHVLASDDRIVEKTSTSTQLGHLYVNGKDLMMVDRDVLVEILLTGEDNFQKNNPDVPGVRISTRQEIRASIDQYVENEDAIKIQTTPGAVLNMYLSTGKGAKTFHQHFQSTRTSQVVPNFYCVFSEQPLDVDWDNTQKQNWPYPQKHSPSPARGRKP